MKGLAPFKTISSRMRDKVFGECVYDAGADAVQSSGRSISTVLKLSARMECRENYLQSAFAGLWVSVNRDASAIIGDGQG